MFVLLGRLVSLYCILNQNMSDTALLVCRQHSSVAFQPKHSSANLGLDLSATEFVPDFSDANGRPDFAAAKVASLPAGEVGWTGRRVAESLEALPAGHAHSKISKCWRSPGLDLQKGPRLERVGDRRMG